MNTRRFVLGSLLAIAAALPLLSTPRPADARVFFGVGFGFPFYAPYYGPPAYYYPPPVVYAPPPPVVYAPPPVVYAPPPAYAAPRTGPSVARCTTPALTCPLYYAKPVGAACACPDAAGRIINGRAG